jgi:hypothetical protein
MEIFTATVLPLRFGEKAADLYFLGPVWGRSLLTETFEDVAHA